MEAVNTSRHYKNFVIALLMLFPIVINSVKIVGNLVLLILVFLGIYILLKEKKNPFKIPELKLFSWITFSYFLVMLISIVQNEGFIEDLYHLGRKAHFLLAPMIVLAIYRVDINVTRLLLSLKMGLIIIGLIVLFQDIYTIESRLSGAFNANIFGDISLVLLFLSIANFIDESLKNKLITIFSSALGVYAISMTGNRATVLMILALGIIYLTIIFIRYFKDKMLLKVFSIIVFLSIIGVLSLNQKVQEGFERAIYSLNAWSNNIPGSNQSSTGMRLSMWSGSFEAFKQAPIFGHGYREANNAVSKHVPPDLYEAVKGYTHLHNEYITNLVSAGLIGLISVISLLLFPFIVFLRNICNHDNFIYSYMGIMLTLSYAGSGMTHIAFGEEHVNAVYIFFLAILLPRVINKEKRIV